MPKGFQRYYDLEHLRRFRQFSKLTTREGAAKLLAKEFPQYYKGTEADAVFLYKKLLLNEELLKEPVLPTAEITKVLPELTVPYRDTLALCDIHAPHFIERAIHLATNLAWANDIGTVALVGDFIDFDSFSSYLKVGASPPEEGFEALAAIIDYLHENFDEILVCMGNHDERLLRKMADLSIGINGILALAQPYAKVPWDRLQYTSRFQIKLEGGPSGDWWLSHMDNYRKVPLSVATEGVIKFQANYLTAHQHHLGAVRSNYGGMWAVDGGALVDPQKTEYLQRRHKMCSDWAPGFTVILDGHPYCFRADEPDAVWQRWGAL